MFASFPAAIIFVTLSYREETETFAQGKLEFIHPVIWMMMQHTPEVFSVIDWGAKEQDLEMKLWSEEKNTE